MRIWPRTFSHYIPRLTFFSPPKNTLQGAQILSNTWLSHWSTVTVQDPEFARTHVWYYLGMYALLGLMYTLGTMAATFIMSWGRYCGP